MPAPFGGTDIYESVQFGSDWLKLRGLPGLGRGIRPTDFHSSYIKQLENEQNPTEEGSEQQNVVS